jgi:hypothetical protein
MFQDKLQNCSLTILKKYLHSDTRETEVNINISVKNSSEGFFKKKPLWLPVS